MIYRVVRKYGNSWVPVTKPKSRAQRLYDHRAYARCAATLLSMTSLAPHGVQGIQTCSDWQDV